MVGHTCLKSKRFRFDSEGRHFNMNEFLLTLFVLFVCCSTIYVSIGMWIGAYYWQFNLPKRANAKQIMARMWVVPVLAVAWPYYFWKNLKDE